LHQLHAISQDPGIRTPSTPSASVPTALQGGGPSALKVTAPVTVLAASDAYPFALIDEISEESPAAIAGFKLGDLIARFAHITYQTPDPLQAMVGALAASEGRPIEAVVLREGSRVHIVLIPQKWAGRGLLGCHLQPVPLR